MRITRMNEKPLEAMRTTEYMSTLVIKLVTRSVDILKFITIVLCCCYCANAAVQAQQIDQKNPQQKYQPMEYQMPQQYEYQQQRYQQQYRQQYEQQQQQLLKLQQQQQGAANQQSIHTLLPITLPLKQQQNYKQPEDAPDSPTTATNGQLLQTSASLVVAAGQKEYYDPETDGQAPIRRRAGNRKRKRRPQLQTQPTLNEETYWHGNVPETVQSKTLQQQAAGGKRRKNTTNRDTIALTTPTEDIKARKTVLPLTERDKSYRRPYAQAKKENTTTVITLPSNSSSRNELRNILKQSGGNMSLSEILQQKNLSLDDLLKGKQNALLALQTTATLPVNRQIDKDGHKQTNNVRRLPILNTASTTASTRSEFSQSANITNESNDAYAKQKLKLSTLQRLKLFGSSSRATASTEVTATKRTTTTSRMPTIISTSSTTRLPLYKKRLQQRLTLKSPGLFKPMPTNKSSQQNSSEFDIEENVKNSAAEFDVDIEQNDLVNSTTTKTTTTTATPSTTTTISTRKTSTLATSTLPANTTTTATTTTTTTTSTIATISSSHIRELIEETKESQTNYIPLNNKIMQDEHNLKTNSIEHDEIQYQPISTTIRIMPTIGNTNYANVDDDDEDVIIDSDDADDDFENFFEEQSTKVNNNSASNTLMNITPRIDNNRKEANYKRINSLAQFTDGVDDRTDLLELIEDRRSGNRLFKILEQRNMTLDELIEHRKRGSSQLHLKTIVQNQSGLFPGQKVILQDNMDIVTAFENFPHFNLMNLKSVRPDDIKTDSQGSSYFTSIIDIEPTDEAYKNEPSSNESGGSVQINEKSVEFFPSWKTLALASLTNNVPNTKDTATTHNQFYLPQSKLLLENVSQDLDDDDMLDNSTVNSSQNDVKEKIKPPTLTMEDDNVVEAIENEVARAHDLLDLELSGHGFKRSPAAAASIAHQQHNPLYTQMPAGIRSAIAASAAIVLTSLATFMVIFVVCRWKQRKRRKSSYMKTYNAMKSKMPALATPSRGSSMRHMEEMVSGIATISKSPVHQLQRQSSLLFTRHNRDESTISAVERASVRASNTLLSSCGLRKHEDYNIEKCMSKKIHHHHHRHDLGNNAGSTTSLALSLQSAHNEISNTKLNPMNTMDPNSPEVQEYLFDALRKSF